MIEGTRPHLKRAQPQLWRRHLLGQRFAQFAHRHAVDERGPGKRVEQGRGERHGDVGLACRLRPSDCVARIARILQDATHPALNADAAAEALIPRGVEDRRQRDGMPTLQHLLFSHRPKLLDREEARRFEQTVPRASIFMRLVLVVSQHRHQRAVH